MKKILCVVLTLLIVLSCWAKVARSEDLESELDDIFEEFVSDVDDFSDQELVALREIFRVMNIYVDMRIFTNLTGSEIDGRYFEKINAGLYYAGSDLSAGKYRIYICEVDESTWEPFIGSTYADTADIFVMDNKDSYWTGGNVMRRMKAGDSTQIELKKDGVLVLLGGWGYAEKISD